MILQILTLAIVVLGDDVATATAPSTIDFSFYVWYAGDADMGYEKTECDDIHEMMPENLPQVYPDEYKKEDLSSKYLFAVEENDWELGRCERSSSLRSFSVFSCNTQTGNLIWKKWDLSERIDGETPCDLWNGGDESIEPMYQREIGTGMCYPGDANPTTIVTVWAGDCKKEVITPKPVEEVPATPVTTESESAHVDIDFYVWYAGDMTMGYPKTECPDIKDMMPENLPYVYPNEYERDEMKSKYLFNIKVADWELGKCVRHTGLRAFSVFTCNEESGNLIWKKWELSARYDGETPCDLWNAGDESIVPSYEREVENGMCYPGDANPTSIVTLFSGDCKKEETPVVPETTEPVPTHLDLTFTVWYAGEVDMGYPSLTCSELQEKMPENLPHVYPDQYEMEELVKRDARYVMAIDLINWELGKCIRDASLRSYSVFTCNPESGTLNWKKWDLSAKVGNESPCDVWNAGDESIKPEFENTVEQGRCLKGEPNPTSVVGMWSGGCMPKEQVETTKDAEMRAPETTPLKPEEIEKYTSPGPMCKDGGHIREGMLSDCMNVQKYCMNYVRSRFEGTLADIYNMRFCLYSVIDCDGKRMDDPTLPEAFPADEISPCCSRYIIQGRYTQGDKDYVEEVDRLMSGYEMTKREAEHDIKQRRCRGTLPLHLTTIWKTSTGSLEQFQLHDEYVQCRSEGRCPQEESTSVKLIEAPVDKSKEPVDPTEEAPKELTKAPKKSTKAPKTTKAPKKTQTPNNPTNAKDNKNDTADPKSLAAECGGIADKKMCNKSKACRWLKNPKKGVQCVPVKTKPPAPAEAPKTPSPGAEYDECSALKGQQLCSMDRDCRWRNKLMKCEKKASATIPSDKPELKGCSVYRQGACWMIDHCKWNESTAACEDLKKNENKPGYNCDRAGTGKEGKKECRKQDGCKWKKSVCKTDPKLLNKWKKECRKIFKKRELNLCVVAENCKPILTGKKKKYSKCVPAVM